MPEPRFPIPINAISPGSNRYELGYMLDHFDLGSLNTALTDDDVAQLRRHPAGPIIHAAPDGY